MKKSLFLELMVVMALVASGSCTATIVRDLLQFNLAGHPVLHKDSTWEFDPDVGKRRSRTYQQLNGRLGEKAIERLGLGIDGYDLERLEEQRIRDQGHLNGLDAYQP